MRTHRLTRALVAALLLAHSTALPRFIFRAGHYFALRTQEPHPILTGLAWINAHATHRGELRGGAWQHHKLQQWGWEANDASGYGREFIGDAYNGVNLTIEYVDSTEHHAADAPCRRWSARITGSPSSRAPAPDAYLSLFSYFAADDASLDVAYLDERSEVVKSAMLVTGTRGGVSSAFLIEESPENVHYLHARTHMSSSSDEGAGADTDGDTSPELDQPHFLGVALPPGASWGVDDVLEEALRTSWSAAAALRDETLQSILDSTGVDAGLEYSQRLVPVLNDTVAEGSTLVLVQHVVSTSAPFEIEWSFLDSTCALHTPAAASGAAEMSSEDVDWPAVLDELDVGMRHGAVAAGAVHRRAAFDSNLCRSLSLCEGATPPLALHVASHALGNLLGSITYFHGVQLVATPGWFESTPPMSLFTGVPSRSFFPRGFLWDEGFHQLVASQVNAHLSQTVLRSWFDMMNTDGYIAREVILGAEAQSRVHSDFWVQFRDHANPPTFFMTALVLAVDGLCGVDHGKADVDNNYDFEFEVDARGDVRREAFPSSDNDDGSGVVSRTRVRKFCAWRHARGTVSTAAPSASSSSSESAAAAAASPSVTRGCTHACSYSKLKPATVTHTSAEAAADAALAAAAATAVGDDGATANATITLSFISELYPKLVTHLRWFQTTQAGPRPHSFRWRGSRPGGDKKVWHHFTSGLDDYPRGLEGHAEDEHVDLIAWMAQSALVLRDLAVLVGDDAGVSEFSRLADTWIAALDRYWQDDLGTFCDRGVAGYTSEGAPILGPVCHYGYIAMMPLLFRLLDPTDARIGRILDWATDAQHTWSEFGLRALSATDPLYGVEETFEEDYWRSSVWININFLTVSALRHYGEQPGPYADRAKGVAVELQRRVVALVVNEYGRTGFLWEHFNSHDGHGRGTHPFTGWTALVALLIADRYPL